MFCLRIKVNDGWIEGHRLKIYMTSPHMHLWHEICFADVCRVYFVALFTLRVERSEQELLKMMSLASRFQNNRLLPPLPMTWSALMGLVEITGDKHSLRLGPAVIISPVFVKAAEWKQAAVKKPARQGEREGGEGADMLWYQMKGLLKPGNWMCELEPMWEQLGGQSNFCFQCRCLGTQKAEMLRVSAQMGRFLSLRRLWGDAEETHWDTWILALLI